ncbi:MAG: hypothetical protein M1833_000047 [Piccolia ochrophora]|nr:MAG: hypothetical protein M1833_000047 [Piccolia ochrophora]
MLGWLSGSAPPSAIDRVAMELKDGPDEESTYDPPETPAPVFALRAFKTALFGTPDHLHANVAEEDEKRKRPTSLPVTGPLQQDANEPSSPTKPAGILMTPGTGAARRKTVSFGESAAKDQADKAERSGLPSDCPGKFPSPWTPNPTTSRSTQGPTALTKSLYKARGTKLNETTDQQRPRKSNALPTKKSSSNDQEKRLTAEEPHAEDDPVPFESDADITLDFNLPRSGSGQWWKTEFESYHQKTQHEIDRLVKYKDMAKAYAKQKDSQAIDLGERLREEKLKVNRMEHDLSELVASMAATQMGDSPHGSDDVHLVRELARQTALSLEYKKKVEEFESALRQSTAKPDTDVGEHGKRALSPDTERVILETSNELKRAREQIKQMDNLRSEARELRHKLKAAERKAQSFEQDRAGLLKEMSRLQDSLDGSERRRVAQEERQKQKDTRVEEQKQDYKDRLAKAKADREKSEATLRNRLAEESVSVRESRQENQRLRQTLLEREAEIRQLKDASVAEVRDVRTIQDESAPPVPQRSPKRPRPSIEGASWWDNSNRSLQDDFYNSKNIGTDQKMDHISAGSPKPRRSLRGSGSTFMDLSQPPVPSSPVEELPIPEQLFSSISGNGRRSIGKVNSPRPSMFSIASSPPRMEAFALPLMTAPTASKQSARKREGSSRLGGTGSLKSSRVGSLATRDGKTLLPPEREAAAKARLEQRRAAKRQLDGSSQFKENVDLVQA